MFSIKQKPKVKWKNWSEIVLSYPEAIHYPTSLEDVIQIIHVCQAKQKGLRVVGAGHSFTPLVATTDLLISLDHLTGIDSVDEKNNRITLWAGTSIKEACILLHEAGYAMENMGDINVQSIAGAISTGTHGTGIDFGSVSTQVTALTIVTPTGNVMEISETENADYFQAARLSLGMLGIIVKVELQTIPSHTLIGESYRMPLDHCLMQLEELKKSNRHFEFFWFPHTELVQVKQMNTVEDNKKTSKKRSAFNDIVVENGMFWLLSTMCRIKPKFSKLVSNISARNVPIGTEVDHSYLVYATHRLVKFNEMEYSFPANKMSIVLRDIKYLLEKNNLHVHFPIECRYVKGDDIWLSPSYQQDSAYIAVHMYKGMDFQAYFKAIEKIFQHHGGRPHWGKIHTMNKDKLLQSYPKLNDFLHVREQFDPHGMLLNSYLRELFAI